jgi:hypothetical protein
MNRASRLDFRSIDRLSVRLGYSIGPRFSLTSPTSIPDGLFVSKLPRRFDLQLPELLHLARPGSDVREDLSED